MLVNKILVIGFLWIVNLTFIFLDMGLEGVTTFNIIALIGVALTGLVPMLKSRMGNTDKNAMGYQGLHVLSGVIGAIGSGLAAGNNRNVWSILAAIVYIISGVYAHMYLLTESERDEIFKDERKMVYESFRTPFIDGRTIIYIVLFVCSAIALIFQLVLWSDYSMYQHPYEVDAGISLISPIVHTVVFLYLTLTEIKSHWLNFILLYISAVLSASGMTFWWSPDWLIVVPVYMYLALAHML